MPPLARPDRDRTVELPPRTAAFGGGTEVLVVGGGPAGLGAAVGAAQAGADVVLVERYGFLGGMGTAAGVTNFCGLHRNVHGTLRQVVQGTGAELLDRIGALDGLNTPHLLFG
ncbi:MAG TPA: FAD-dependent oxidoreductase, partial [Thermoleophilaceae bacterium]|nr:FAD-dependent oxidoreductase [Thermoleophilaceae bacterium]